MPMIIKDMADLRTRSVQHVDEMWTNLSMERQRWLMKSQEVRAYLTQTSTDDTEVGRSLPWKNKTSIPKLTQIADNLNAYYMAALMPDDEWFVWEGEDEESIRKAKLIQRWMRTKLRLGKHRDELEKIVRDWIFYGNAFGGVRHVRKTRRSLVTGQEYAEFIGPQLYRISPLDVVVDPRAASFDESPFIVRSWVPITELLTYNDRNPGDPYDEGALEMMKKLRGPGAPEDWTEFIKESGIQMDGFDIFSDYLGQQYVEVLEFWGDLYLEDEGTVLKDYRITVADRLFELRRNENPSWSGRKPFFHVGWRIVPDNLYGQGPMDNLVGMQYRVDHLENLKADTFDQIVHPAMAIIGDEVDGGSFEWGPGAKLYLPDGGSVDVLRPDATVLQANSEIGFYFSLMEEMAGSPREMAGFRTPGEKTAFEVGVLQQGGDRMFQDKLNHFETFGTARYLNLMFELGVRNMDSVDISRTFNDDEDAMEILEVTREEVVADGNFRPVGSKHFAARSKRIQELSGMMQMISVIPSTARHISSIKFAEMLERELGFEKFKMVQENIALREDMQAQVLMQMLQENAQGIAQGLSGAASNGAEGSSPDGNARMMAQLGF
jgi:hypothetical protein